MRGESEAAQPFEDLSEAVDGDAEPPHCQLGVTLPGSARVWRQEFLLIKDMVVTEVHCGGKSGFRLSAEPSFCWILILSMGLCTYLGFVSFCNRGFPKRY